MAASAGRRPTVKQVAERAGVAPMSVSRVLSGHPDVSDAMRDRVLRAVTECGYEPDLLAKGLRAGTTMTIGILVSEIMNPLFADIVSGAEELLRENGYGVLLVHSRGEAERDVESIRMLRQRRVDGLLLSVADETSESLRALLESSEQPVVLLDRTIAGLDASAVVGEHRSGIQEAVAHLRELGHERIALIAGPYHARPSRERLEGYYEAFRAHGLEATDEYVRHGSLDASFGYECAHELLALPRRPTALVAGGNMLFTGTLEALHQAECRIPDDMALVACDDVPLARLHTPAVTVVARDTYRMGRQAADLLLQRLVSPDAPTSIEHVPTRLVVRASTGA